MTTSHSKTAIHFADLPLTLQNPKPQAMHICAHLFRQGLKAYIRKGTRFWEIWREALESYYSGLRYYDREINRRVNAPETSVWKPHQITPAFVLLDGNALRFARRNK